MPIRLSPAQEQALGTLDRLPPGSLYVIQGGPDRAR